MKVLLIDVDSKMPNLALMKLSAFHKKQGDQVYLMKGLGPELPLLFPDPDIAYISCVFDRNGEHSLLFAEKLRASGIRVASGGPAIGHELPEHIEHIMPDYSLYGADYSMGFTSRGCIRQCPWCSVWRREGQIRNHAPISEFLHPDHKKLILLDNNLLASPNGTQVLEELATRNILVNINQGLDHRLITDENAKLLKRIRYYDRHFKNRRLHFAFDTPGSREKVILSIETLERNGIPRHHLMFYILTGYDSSFSADMQRIQILLRQNVLPYIMVYNDRRNQWYPALERWINRRYYRFVPWEKYDHGDSQQIIAAMR